jgi:hypothetical protein
MGLTRTGTTGAAPYEFTQDNSGKANAIVGIYVNLPAVERFLIGALILTLSPPILHVAVDTTGNNVADTWLSFTATAETKPGDRNGR